MARQVDYLYLLLNNIIRNGNYNINSKDVKLQLMSNPSYPSLRAITDTLDYFKIENMAAIIPKKLLNSLPDQFLAVVNRNDSNEVVKVNRIENSIKYVDATGRKSELTKKQFEKIWNGSVVVIENLRNDKWGIRKLFNKSFALKLLCIFLSITMLGYFLGDVFNLYLILSILGIGVTYFIIKEELGTYDAFTSKICESDLRNISCSDIIGSEKAKLINSISLGDLCVSFFASTIVISLILGFDFSFFFYTAILSIPVVLYSIYLQGVVIKAWCPLCLAITFILSLQFVFLLFETHNLGFYLSYIISSVIIFSITLWLWSIVKKLLKDSIELDHIKTELLTFKRNENIFRALLDRLTFLEKNSLPENVKLNFGNPKASLVIDYITSPTCGYCKSSFQIIKELLDTHGDHFGLNIIFNVPIQSKNNTAVQIAQVVSEHYLKNPDDAYVSLSEWFESRDFSKWQNQYGYVNKDADYAILETHNFWCKSNGINYTPALIIDGAFFPADYDIKDLPLFIDYLIESKKENQ